MKKGQIIKQIRKSKHMSAEQLAEKIGISPATMYRYENGELSKIPDVTINKLAEVLGVRELHRCAFGGNIRHFVAFCGTFWAVLRATASQCAIKLHPNCT